MIRVQADDFDVGAEFAALSQAAGGAGAVAMFVGLVRDVTDGAAVDAMTLEHYPAMTLRQLAAIEDEAARRWPLAASLIVHRHGRLEPGEKIVLVAAASAHRDDAFDACRFLIDRLKTQAPFWKVEEGPDGRRWVDARAGDDDVARRWQRCADAGDHRDGHAGGQPGREHS